MPAQTETILELADRLGLKRPAWDIAAAERSGVWQCWVDRVLNVLRLDACGNADWRADAARDADIYAGHAPAPKAPSILGIKTHGTACDVIARALDRVA